MVVCSPHMPGPSCAGSRATVFGEGAQRRFVSFTLSRGAVIGIFCTKAEAAEGEGGGVPAGAACLFPLHIGTAAAIGYRPFTGAVEVVGIHQVFY